MKKIFLIVFLLFTPIMVNAEECTDEMVASYLPTANSVYMEYESTANPDTYKIYVFGLSTGLSYSGINGTRFGDGYYAFANVGDTFTITIKVADGSVCALREIKNVSIKLPGKEIITPPVDPNPPVTEPDIPITNDNDNKTPTVPVIKNPSVIDSNNDNEILEEEKENDTASEEIIKEEVVQQDTSKDEKSADINSKNNNNNEFIDKEISDYLLLIITGTIFFTSGILIYIKKFKGHK